MNEQLCEDLKIAARFLMDNGFSLDHEEAFRIGLVLAELAGSMRHEKEQQDRND
jgi:hypothetical protein